MSEVDLIEVELQNKDGQTVSIVNIHSTEETPNVITWGNRLFVWNGNRNVYKEGFIVPAIIKKSEKK